MRISKLAAATLSVLGLLACLSAPARAEDPRMAERTVGNAKAPVTVVEYYSLTCSHCAEFATKTYPELKSRYIDTGKVRFVFREFPLDGTALKASAIARCLPAEQYVPFTHVLLDKQDQWAFGKDAEKNLLRYASLAGLGEDQARACMTDNTLLDAIIAQRTDAESKNKISATPTFIINDGAEILRGGLPLDDFTAAIDRVAAKKK